MAGMQIRVDATVMRPCVHEDLFGNQRAAFVHMALSSKDFATLEFPDGHVTSARWSQVRLLDSDEAFGAMAWDYENEEENDHDH